MTNKNNETVSLLAAAFRAFIEHIDFFYNGDQHMIHMNYKGPKGFKVSLDTSYVPAISMQDSGERNNEEDICR